MVGPADGKGTREDPWRPKYLRELNLRFSSQGNLRSHMLCAVAEDDGDVANLSELAAQPDVIELPAGKFSADDQARIGEVIFETARAAGVAIPIDSNNIGSVAQFKAAILNSQRMRTEADEVKLLESLKARRAP